MILDCVLYIIDTYSNYSKLRSSIGKKWCVGVGGIMTYIK